jgi:hypothetical protein
VLLLLSLGISGQSLDVTFNPSVFNGGYHVSCNGASDGTLEAIIVGGQPPYSFQWSTGAYTKTITNLAAGTYSISVIDAAQDTIIKSYTLIASEALTGSLDVSSYGGGFNVSAQGAADGWITAVIGGGATPYTYQWSNGAETETNHDLPSGSYSVIVRDVNQCQLQLSTSLTQPTPLHIVSITSPLHNGYNLSCKSSDDGAIDLTVSGGVAPYTYQWSNGNFTQDLADLKAGEYTVLVKDLNGVGVTASITLTQPGSIEVDLTAPTYPNGHHTTCYNCSNGSVTTTVTGGVMPYTYSWNTGQNTQNLSNLMAGTYSVLVTDANGCTKPDVKIDLTEPDRDDWTINGNSFLNEETDFIGTTDSTELVLKSNNVEGIKINSSGNIRFSALAGGNYVNYLFVDSLGNLFRTNPGTGGGGNQLPFCYAPVIPWYSEDATMENIFLCDTRNVGIGTSDPQAHLHLNYSDNVALKITMNNYPDASDPIQVVDNNNNVMFKIGNTGSGVVNSLAINTSLIPTGYKLGVNGKIICEEIKVKMHADWPDFVFGDNYSLRSLTELEAFIKDNRCLPGLKSAAEVQADGGISLSETSRLLLLKIEELTLYIIEQEKRIQKLENQH